MRSPEIPEARFDIDRYYDPDPARRGKLYIRRGGFADDADRFDAAFFRISPREAAQIDPQQRMLLEVAWEALEDGGQTLATLAGSRTGVFVGLSTHDFATVIAGSANRDGVEAHTATGTAASIAANRISYVFDLRGPSIVLDTACSSSLTAVHLACRSLMLRESELALAGGVNLFLTPDSAMGLAKASMLSPDGQGRAFDARANGFVRGEGAGVVVLKPLDAALRDRDRIHALILASAINQDGRTVGITVPNADAQQAMFQEALAAAGVEPSQVGYVEAHGTGTVVGDPVEARAIGAVFSAARDPGDALCIGSAKTNIGHLEAAAGIAGLIKAALVLAHRQIPPHLHFVEPNPAIPFGELRLKVPITLQPWPGGGDPAIAGVNSFGFGGANAHVLMQEAPAPEHPSAADLAGERARPRVLVLSAKEPEPLRQRARDLARFLGDTARDLDDVCHTLAIRRTHLEHRLAVVGHDRSDIVATLESFGNNASSAHAIVGRAPTARAPKLALVFTGMGPQFAGMGCAVLHREPVFRGVLERCDEVLQPIAGWSLVAALTDETVAQRVGQAAVAQVTNYALQAGLVALLRSWGIVGDAVTGHSVGEIAAAHAAGVLSLEDGLRLVHHRGRLVERASGMGRMLTAAVSPEDGRQLIAPYHGRVSMAAINSACSVTFSGEAAALGEIAGRLEAQQVLCRFLAVTVPYHSAALDGLRDEFVASLADLRASPARLPIVSTTLGDWATRHTFDAAHWWRNLRDSVRFAAAATALVDDGFELFLEVGPRPVLRAYLQECLDARSRPGLVLPTLRQGEDDVASLLRSIGALHASGLEVDWDAVSAGRGRCISLPTYPWQRETFGTGREILERTSDRLGGVATGHPLLGVRLPTARPTWQADLDDPMLDYLTDHRVQGAAVYPAAAYIEAALAAGAQLWPGTRASIASLTFEKMLVLSAPREQRIQIACDADGNFELHSRAHPEAGSWSLHARGKLSNETRTAPRARVEIDAIRRRCTQARTADDLYDLLRERGLEYRGAFRSIQSAWGGPEEAVGRIRLPDAGSTAQTAYCVHPAMLDCALQMLILAHKSGSAMETGSGFLPASAERVDWFGAVGTAHWAHAEVRQATASGLQGDVRILDDQGEVLLEIRGIRAVRVSATAEHGPTPLCLHEIHWQEKPPARRAGVALPSPAAIVADLPDFVDRSGNERARFAYADPIRDGLNTLAAAFIRDALATLGCDVRAPRRVPIPQLAQSLGVAERHHRLLARLVEIARTATPLGDVADAGALARRLSAQYSDWAGTIELIVRSGDSLADILRGRREPQEVLFSPEALAILKRVYTDAPSLAYYNRALAESAAIVARAAENGARLRVLEIGAGTGGATAAVLSRLPAGAIEYSFTDVSPFFLAQARDRFGDRTDVTFSILDIEAEPAADAPPLGQFDLVIAANVIHGTADARGALRNVGRLLAPNGLFMMLELVAPEFWADLIFGLFQGWWRFGDIDLRPAHAILGRDRWLSVFAESGFDEPVAIPDLDGDPNPLHTVILARKGAGADSAGVGAERPKWMIVADRSSVAGRLAAALERRGQACALVDTAGAIAAIDGHCVGVIHLASLDLPLLDGLSARQPMESVLHCLANLRDLLRAVDAGARPAAQLWLVTAGAQKLEGDVEPLRALQGSAWAVGRVIMEEFPGIRCRLADLGPAALTEELEALATEICADEGEEEFAFRGLRCLVARITAVSAQELEQPDVERAVSVDQTPVRLEIDAPGTLESLSLRALRPARAGPDELLVRVHAAGLNFKDVMHALGLLPFALGDPRSDTKQAFGFECSGVVVAVGARVTGFRPGDEICGIATGTLASHVRMPAQFAFHRPDSLGMEDAAGILLPFTTAHFGLNRLARIEPRERVLIHSATGGVGLAAIQVCENAGAEVFATAGTPEKRAFLRSMGIEHVMDSRSLEFADRVLEITRGEGVDVILNSLDGAAIAKGLSILRPFGRFVEIGKRDFLENSQLGLAPFERHLAFFAVDLDRVRKERPETCAALSREVIAEFEAGRLRPPPRTDFDLSGAQSAFRFMARGKHIGKIVLTARQTHYAARRTRAQFLFAADATYLVTGGLGGFGLATAQWMVEQGARHVALTGRHPVPRPRDQPAFDKLLASGANVVVLAADVAVEAEVARVLAHIARSMPPLRGVFHEAMVLEDQRILDLTVERWERVLAPKITGAWNLHRLTADLDYFVLFSSATVVLGNVGQASYAAANAFLDALASHRRALGLPGLSVAWGLLGDVGLVVDRPDLQRYFHRIGFEAIAAEEAFARLDEIIRSGAGYAMPFRMNWSKLATLTARDRKRSAEMLRVALGTRSQRASAGSQEPAESRDILSGADPQGALEAHLLQRVATVLGADPAKLDVEVPLTNLGLDSLMAVELESAIKRDLALKVTAVRLLQGLGIRQLAHALRAQGRDEPNATRAEPVQRAITRLPLAPGQRRLWFLQQLDPTSIAYNMPLAIRISGALDVRALQAAVNEVVRRQEALRATFTDEDGTPVQWIAPETEVLMPRVDISADPDPAQTLERLTREETCRVFDLSQGPLITTRLVRVSDLQHVLLATAHHLVVDAWSAGIITRQAADYYRTFALGAAPAAKSLLVSYGEFVLRQAETEAKRADEQLAYWEGQLRDAVALRLPTDRPRLPARSSCSERLPFDLEPELLASLDVAARREGATLFVLLLAAFQLLLARHAGQDDFCVGTPVASRFDDDSRELVGCFVNTLAMRARVSGSMTFRELLAQTRQTVLAAAANQDVTWERVVERLNPPRESGELPILQTLFVLHNFPMASAELPGLVIESSLTPTGSSPFELTMMIDSNARRGAMEYSSSLFDAATIRTMIRNFVQMLEDIVADPDQVVAGLPRASESERNRLLAELNRTEAGAPAARCLHHLFEEQAARTPDGIALVSPDERMTYRQLDEAADRLAAVLESRGVATGSRVGIALERSLRAVVAMLATLKAGGVFTPLDVDAPAERWRTMLADARAVVVLTERRFAERCGSACPVIALDDEAPHVGGRGLPRQVVEPKDLAYVIYTSGSTGRPKGVMIEHGSICNQIFWRQSAFPLAPGDAVLQSTSLAFDPAVWEVFGPLAAGAAVVIATGAAHDGGVLNRLIREHGVTTLQAVPSVLRALLDQGAFVGCRSLKRVFCGGEPLDAALQDRFFAVVDAELVNLYGCTETAIDASYHCCEKGRSSAVAPIGRPIANTRLYVLNERLQPVPEGVPGELYVAGAGVARGYLNDPEPTVDRFIPDPVAPRDGTRAFRTGDLARWSRGGELELLGRVDRQLKVRGFRIEAAEVELALRCHPGVRETAVGVRHHSDGESRLVAWLVPAEGTRPPVGEIRAFLATRLPESMLPSHYVWIEALPLRLSGKVDVASLPGPGDLAEGHVPPRTELEQALARLWEEVLGTSGVGITDNFFDLGGHSLLAVRLVARMSALLGREIRCREFFSNPTIEGLAATTRHDRARSETAVEG